MRPAWIVGLALVGGCSKQDEITRDTVDKPLPLEPVAGASAEPGQSPTDQPTEPTDRTLGAIVPLVQSGWFFKLTGPKDPVEAQREAFTTFLKTVRFDDQEKPTWKLPEGWRQEAGNQIRFATLIVPGSARPLELSVVQLPHGGDDAKYVLDNVNRWRGQLGLAHVSAAQLDAESTHVELERATATVVDLLGRAKPDGMGRPPFLSGARDGN